MTRKKKKLVVSIIIILSMSLLFTIFRISIYKDRIEMARSSISAGTIQQNLGFLGAEISNQEMNQWNSSEKIMFYLQNVSNGISVTMQSTQDLQVLSDQELETLNRLYSLMGRYLYPMPTGKLELTDNEKEELIVLRDHLRENGWGDGAGYSGDWSNFIERTNHFLNNDFVPQVIDTD